MAGSCDAYIRSANRSTVLYLPLKFWGLSVGEAYRVILFLYKLPQDQIPYSFDAVPVKVGASARITIPRCVRAAEPGDMVRVWVGRPEDYNDKRGWAIGRGNTQTERTQYLEDQADILRRCAGK